MYIHIYIYIEIIIIIKELMKNLIISRRDVELHATRRRASRQNAVEPCRRRTGSDRTSKGN